jgi:hypothetical protein
MFIRGEGKGLGIPCPSPYLSSKLYHGFGNASKITNNVNNTNLNDSKVDIDAECL